MFGITRLTAEEKREHTKLKRIVTLEVLINKESLVRATSLAKAEVYTQELDRITK